MATLVRSLSATRWPATGLRTSRLWQMVVAPLVKRRVGLAVSTGATATAASIGAAGHYYAKRELGDDAVDRTLSFYAVAVPAFLEYKWLEWRTAAPTFFSGSESSLSPREVDAAFDALHDKWAPRFLDKYLELRGFYLKQGQGIATNVADLFPKRWQEAMAPILDRVPPLDGPRAREILANELSLSSSSSSSEGGGGTTGNMGQSLADFGFESVDWDAPLGSASIGQVHRARYRGRDVVVKLQYPDAERTFRGDVFAVKKLCKALFPQYFVAFKEIERQFATEFDYRGEAENSETIRKNLLRVPRFANAIKVPKIHLASKRVLIMDELESFEPLTVTLRRLAHKEAYRRGVESVDALVADEDRRDAEAARRGETRSNGLLERWWLQKDLQAWDPKTLVDTLLDVHGHQVLVDGVFNADCHPGNVMLSTDKRRKAIGLIDYGQVKRLDTKARLRVARLLLLVDAAVARDPRTTSPNSEEESVATAAVSSTTSTAMTEKRHRAARRAVADEMLAAGFRTRACDVDVLYELASVYFGRDDRAWIYPRNFQQWTEHVERRDPVLSLDECEDMVMVVRCGLLLRGLGHCLHEHRNLAAAWKPIATQVLREAGQLDAILAQIAAFDHHNEDEEAGTRAR